MKPDFTDKASALGAGQRIDIFLGQLRLMEQQFNTRPADIDDPEWVKAKLQHMFDIDQFCIRSCGEIRSDYSASGSLDAAWDAWGRVNHQNIVSLKLIIDRHGWPAIGKFGQDADKHAWLIVQHADDDTDFQRRCLSLLEKLYPVGETAKDNYAYLYDRVQVSNHDPSKRQLQRFGTQGDLVDGRWQPFPIEDAENVDTRRAEFNIFLTHLADYTHLMNLQTDAQKDEFMAALKPPQP